MNEPSKTVKRTAKKILAVAGLGAISLLLAFVLGEAYIRAFHPQVSPLGFNYLTPDERLRYRNRPDCTLTFARDEIDADFFTNSQGFRNVEEPEGATRGKTVLFLGDSFTFGHGVRQEEVFSVRFKERAVQEGKRVNIINAGTIGYGTDQEYLFLRDQGIALKPDLVVVNMYINDPADNIWRSLFYLDETGALIENPTLRYTPVMKLRWFKESK